MRWTFKTFKIGFLKAHAEGNMSWASKGRLKGARVYTKKLKRFATLGLGMYSHVK